MTIDPNEIQALLERLFPICRSLTGEGVRETLRILQEIAEFSVNEVPSGMPCFDWVVPDEWNIRDACLDDENGRRWADFRVNNLHVVNYSLPVDEWLSFDELEPHLHTLPQLPDAIPYRTSYYVPTWGFCVSQRDYDAMDRSLRYHAKIESTLAPGSMTYGEASLEGTSGEEFLVSTYCCHPSMANDNLSGVVLWAFLLRALEHVELHHSYRFIVIPETIGAIYYLSANQEVARRLSGCLLPSNVGGAGPLGFKETFLGDHRIDRIIGRVFSEMGLDPVRYPFDVMGSDERQYSSPAFRIPTATVCKDKYYEFPYYHTSLDNLSFVTGQSIAHTLEVYLRVIAGLESDRRYLSLNPEGEPMLGKRGLYKNLGGSLSQPAHLAGTDHSVFEYDLSPSRTATGRQLDAMRWVLFYADGATSILEIAEKTKFSMVELHAAAQVLEAHGLVKEIPTKVRESQA